MIDDDPCVFLADWGEEGVLDGDAVRGIFAEPYAVAPVGDAGMSTGEPRFVLPTAAVPARVVSPASIEPVLDLFEGAARRHADGVPFRYRVRAAQPDGTGWTSLILVEHESQAV